MKTSAKFLATAALALSSAGLQAQLHGDPFHPVGSLDIAQKMVRSGKKTHMDWNITYPITIPDLLIPAPGGRIITKEEVRMRIRVLGVAFQSGSTLLPAKLQTKIGSGSWEQHFNGKATDVQPTHIVYDAIVPANTVVDFRARGKSGSGSWYDWRSTQVDDIAVVGLQNGDTPPSYAPAYSQGSIEDFLSGYISNGNEVTIGPRDMIYLFELASRNPGDWYFDMQDIVVIVNYEPTSTTYSAP